MDGSSFSEEDDSSCSYNNKCPECKRQLWVLQQYKQQRVDILIAIFAFSVPNCVLTKELLTDGLKVLISKEDELLYAARVHTLELPDM